MSTIRTLRPTRAHIVQDGPRWFVWDGAQWLCQSCATDDVFGRAHIADRQFGAAIRAGAIQDVPKPTTCATCGLAFDVHDDR